MRRLDGDDAGLLGIAPRVPPRVGPLGRGHDDLALDLEIGTGMLELEGHPRRTLLDKVNGMSRLTQVNSSQVITQVRVSDSFTTK